MVLLLEVLAVLAVVFGVAVVLTGRSEGLSDESGDYADTGIPRDRAMTADDVVGLRFALAFRGYRMSEVDEALDRLAAEVGWRDEEIARLRDVAGRASATTEDSEPAYVPSDATGDVPAGTVEGTPELEWPMPPAPDPEPAREPDLDPGFAPDPEPDYAPVDEYIPSDATGEVADGTEVDVLAAPDAGEPVPDAPEFRAPDPLTDPLPEVLAAAPTVDPTPAFEAPDATQPMPAIDPEAPSPYRPSVPDIPYDPWSVTPRSRYTDGPTYVEVEHDDDPGDEQVAAITEHHTGYAPTPTPDEPGAGDDTTDDTTDEAGDDGPRHLRQP